MRETVTMLVACSHLELEPRVIEHRDDGCDARAGLRGRAGASDAHRRHAGASTDAADDPRRPSTLRDPGTRTEFGARCVASRTLTLA